MSHEERPEADDMRSAGSGDSDVAALPERASVSPEVLRASEERFRLLADNIAQLAWMADASGWIFWYNRRWFEYTGTTLQQMQGWGWQKVHHPDHLERVVQKIRHSFETGEAWEDLFPLRGTDGEYRWFLSRALPIRNAAGELLCWFGTNTDVTAQREAEQRLLEADRRKNEFLAMLGHELRNPLAAMRSATAVIEGLQLEQPPLQKALRVLERQSAHMARLIDGLLDASRIAHGKIELRREALDLCALAAAVLSDLEPFAAACGLTLRVAIAAGPVWVSGDATRLTQIMENLVGNALKFSERPAEVSVRLERQTDHARFCVRDQGRGIRADMLHRIFQPFEQDPQDASRAPGGLGLGLAVAKGLVELHGGSIAVASQGEGMGAEFVVRLPLIAAPTTARPPARPPLASHPLRVLVVEDNEDAGSMLCILLERRGHTACLVHCGEDGLSLLGEQAFDVVLCDLGLPDMSGHELARRVRAEPALRDVVLIATTGYGQQQDQARSREAGFDRHLTKPISAESLERALAEVRVEGTRQP